MTTENMNRRLPLDLFTPPSVKSGASRDAAVRVRRNGRATALREQILALLTAAGDTGLTRVELHLALSEQENSIRPRVWELMRAGLVRQTDRRRESRGHGPCTVLVRVGA